jgi:hypothetical protein
MCGAAPRTSARYAVGTTTRYADGAPVRTPVEEDLPMVKIAIVGLAVAFVIFYIITSPSQAADMAKGIGHLTTSVAHGVGNFLDKLAS